MSVKGLVKGDDERKSSKVPRVSSESKIGFQSVFRGERERERDET